MTIDERRQAWRAYMTAVLSASDFKDYAMDDMAVAADLLLKTERQRFDTPDHSGDANKMVEPPIAVAQDLLALVEEAIGLWGTPHWWPSLIATTAWLTRAQHAVAKARGGER